MAKTIMIFRSALAESYSGRVEKYLQPGAVSWNFFAETPAAFTEITRNSSGKWDVLLVDSLVVEKHATLLERFIDENPRAVIGVEYQPPNPPTVHLRRSILFEVPRDIDEWLGMMYELLTASFS